MPALDITSAQRRLAFEERLLGLIPGASRNLGQALGDRHDSKLRTRALDIQEARDAPLGMEGAALLLGDGPLSNPDLLKLFSQMNKQQAVVQMTAFAREGRKKTEAERLRRIQGVSFAAADTGNGVFDPETMDAASFAAGGRSKAGRLAAQDKADDEVEERDFDAAVDRARIAVDKLVKADPNLSQDFNRLNSLLLEAGINPGVAEDALKGRRLNVFGPDSRTASGDRAERGLGIREDSQDLLQKKFAAIQEKEQRIRQGEVNDDKRKGRTEARRVILDQIEILNKRMSKNRDFYGVRDYQQDKEDQARLEELSQEFDALVAKQQGSAPTDGEGPPKGDKAPDLSTPSKVRDAVQSGKITKDEGRALIKNLLGGK